MNNQRLCITFVLTVFLGGCQIFFPSKSIPVSSGDLEEVCAEDWVLDTMLIDGKPQELVAGVEVTLGCEVQANSTKVDGMASINRYFGHMTIDSNDRLKWQGPGFATTMMAGPEELMSQEHSYLQLLQQSCGIAIEGKTIAFSCDENNKLIFRDRFK